MPQFFQSLFGWLYPSTSESASASPQAADTQTRLDEAIEQVDRFIEAHRVAQESARDRSTEEDRARRQHEAHQKMLQEDILALHRDLETGLAAPQLDALDRMLRVHSPQANPVGVEEQVDSAVLELLLQRLGRLAWERLNELMSLRQIEWPLPAAIEYHRTPEEVVRCQELRVSRIRDTFFQLGHFELANLLSGDIPIWLDYYPERGGALWKQTALEAVGAGLWGQLYAAALEIWLWRPPELESKLRGLLRVYVQEHCAGPVGSLEQALEMTERLQRLCHEAAPQMVWEFLESRLMSDGWGQVAILASGVGRVDPVCGMTLTPEKANCQHQFQGQTFYFCRPECLESFLSDPSSYLGGVQR